MIAPSKPTAPAQTTLQSADKVDAVDNAKKRKREAVDESDPKLKEFLKVMQPSGRSIHDTDFQVTEERPAKIKAVAVPENESDDEYEHVPAKRKLAAPQVRNEDKLATALPVVSSTAPAAKAEAQDEQHGDADGDAGMTEVPSTAPVASATDDDWLRTRTNRLLDLVDDPDEMLLQPSKTSQSAVAGAPPVQPPSAVVVDATDTEAVVPPVAQPEQEPTEDLATVRAPDDDDLERIRKTGRLFVRNLPYTATADALRIHFEQWGDVEEVSSSSHFFLLLLVGKVSFLLPARFHDESQIGTAYAKTAFDETSWARVLVDAEFLKILLPCFISDCCHHHYAFHTKMTIGPRANAQNGRQPKQRVRLCFLF